VMKKPYLVTLVSANEEPPMFVTARSPKAAVDQVALLLTPKAEMFPRFAFWVTGRASTGAWAARGGSRAHEPRLPPPYRRCR
jgi:hypothetical protein